MNPDPLPPPPDGSPPPSRPSHSPAAFVVAAIPVAALTLGIPFANRLEPRVAGLPFLLVWIVTWILLTPVCLTLVAWLDRRRRD